MLAQGHRGNQRGACDDEKHQQGGRDRTEKEYAVHDTHQALIEAKRAGIVPFLITVDKEGHDYMKQLCSDVGYEVVDDIEQLPRRLTSLYRVLAGG